LECNIFLKMFYIFFSSILYLSKALDCRCLLEG
jgi:hypothetical protein